MAADDGYGQPTASNSGLARSIIDLLRTLLYARESMLILGCPRLLLVVLIC